MDFTLEWVGEEGGEKGRRRGKGGGGGERGRGRGKGEREGKGGEGGNLKILKGGRLAMKSSEN